jgi:hypothetical protein
MLPRVAHQATDPSFGKSLNKTNDVRFLSASENHAVAGSYVDDEQHVFALHSDRS